MKFEYVDQMHIYFFTNKKSNWKNWTKESESGVARTEIGSRIEYHERWNSLDRIGTGSEDIYADVRGDGEVTWRENTLLPQFRVVK